MKIIVNDANILIDLVKLELLPNFFSLNLTFHTSDLILDELHDWQAKRLQPFINNGILKIYSFTADELIEIALLQAERTQLSEQDCSAIVCAKKIGGDLLTSDNNLRKFATHKNLKVYGHLWVFDQMIEAQTISGATAIEKLQELREVINPRLGLPKHECENRISRWKNNL